jgi:SAM-dependent methyltransferase
MKVISKRYAREQARMHAAAEAYGSRGYNWAYLVAGIALIERCNSILDYGCGKGTLAETLRVGGLEAAEYDPAIAGKNARPLPAELVVCTDVLEHVEPFLLANVVSELMRVTQRLLFVAISTRPSGRLLSNGENAHLVIKGDKWWRQQFANRFAIRRVWNTGGHEWVALLARN